MTAPLPRRIAWFAPWTWKRRWQRLLVYSFLILGYPLSYGPVWVGYYGRYRGWAPRWVLLFYEPLLWLIRENPTLRPWLTWYLNFFR